MKIIDNAILRDRSLSSLFNPSVKRAAKLVSDSVKHKAAKRYLLIDKTGSSLSRSLSHTLYRNF
ncbi:hypothetical protein BWD162_000600 [Bartonella sp. WD16.2]|nr:hypothetical protein BWD162_000600 [Bartonella sp. WD16.2]